MKKEIANDIINPLDSKSLLMDAELLSLAKEAEEGCLHSQLLMADAFSTGKKAKRDDKLLLKYEVMIFNNTDDTTLKTAVLWNQANRHRKNGNFVEMKEAFHRMITYMLEHVPMEQWCFDVINDMEKCIDEFR